MAKDNRLPEEEQPSNLESQKGNASRNPDLSDSPHDQERLKPDEATIELPDVSEIPGQENIHVPPLGELADVTISSDDEEGIGVFTDDEDDETVINMGSAADISKEEKEILKTSADSVPTIDETRLRNAGLDNTDFEGDPLNVKSFGAERSGDDLDVPGSEEDYTDELAGTEDEENNPYSLNDDDTDSPV